MNDISNIIQCYRDIIELNTLNSNNTFRICELMNEGLRDIINLQNDSRNENNTTTFNTNPLSSFNFPSFNRNRRTDTSINRQNNVRQNNVRQNNVRQNNVRHDNVRQNNVRQDNVRQDNVRQNNVRQDMNNINTRFNRNNRSTSINNNNEQDLFRNLFDNNTRTREQIDYDRIFQNIFNSPLVPSLVPPLNQNFDFLTPVIVRPSARQIENATELAIFNTIESPQNRTCPITQDNFQDNDTVRRIKYCGHIYKDDSLMTWFHSNVRCPLCRYDIRNYIDGINMNNNTTTNETIPSSLSTSTSTSSIPNNDNNEDEITENISLVRTLSREQNRPNIDISNNTNLLNLDSSNNITNMELNMNAGIGINSSHSENIDASSNNLDISNNATINLQDSVMSTLANRMADDYINNMSNNNSPISQGLQDGTVNLEYTLYTPFNNTFYTVRRNNQNTPQIDSSNNDYNNNNNDNNNNDNNNNYNEYNEYNYNDNTNHDGNV